MDQIGGLELLSRCVVEGFLSGKRRRTRGLRRVRSAPPLCRRRRDSPHRLAGLCPQRPLLRPPVRGRDQPASHIALDTSGSMRLGLSTISNLNTPVARRRLPCPAAAQPPRRDQRGDPARSIASCCASRQNAAHLQAILFALKNAVPSEGGNWPLLSLLHSRKRGLFILFSDCFGNVDELAPRSKCCGPAATTCSCFKCSLRRKFSLTFGTGRRSEPARAGRLEAEP